MLSTPRFMPCLLLFLGLILQSCSSTGKPDPRVKIGMHIDAVLEFVVEYPLTWSKERRVTFGSRQGEVRWTYPDLPHTLLRIKSFIPEQSTLGIEQQVDQVLSQHKGLGISTREAVTLPAGDAWHITGTTAHENVDIYLFLRAGRNYSIELTAPLDSIDTDKDLMERITRSFQAGPE